MTKDLLSLQVRMSDMTRTLVYIVKNSMYDEEVAGYTEERVQDISRALEYCARVLDEVLVGQHKVHGS